jgi:hypothetical protein
MLAEPSRRTSGMPDVGTKGRTDEGLPCEADDLNLHVAEAIALTRRAARLHRPPGDGTTTELPGAKRSRGPAEAPVGAATENAAARSTSTCGQRASAGVPAHLREPASTTSLGLSD